MFLLSNSPIWNQANHTAFMPADWLAKKHLQISIQTSAFRRIVSIGFTGLYPVDSTGLIVPNWYEPCSHCLVNFKTLGLKLSRLLVSGRVAAIGSIGWSWSDRISRRLLSRLSRPSSEDSPSMFNDCSAILANCAAGFGEERRDKKKLC